MRSKIHPIKITKPILWGLLTEVIAVSGMVVIGYLICLFLGR